MSRFVTFCAAVLLILGASIAYAPRAAADSGGSNIKGVGGGWVSFQPATSKHYVQFSFSAHEGPNGDFGQAQFSIKEFYPLDVWVNVDCVNVFPVPLYRGGGWFSGIVTKVNDPTGVYSIPGDLYSVFAGDRVFFEILDGGDPSSAVPVDSFNAVYAWGVSSLPCHQLTAADFFINDPDVTSGNIVIDPDDSGLSLP